jgi:glycosyltransferase involved in cell wall biosynthesis
MAAERESRANTPVKVLWSHPMTAPCDVPLPAGFEQVWREGERSAIFRRRFWFLGRFSEYVLRIYLVFALWRRRRRFDVIATGRYGEYFAIFQSLWPFGRRPLLLLDVEWYSEHSSTFNRMVNRWLHHHMAKGATRVQVFCRVEAANYSRKFDVPKERFVWIPLCTSPVEETRPAHSPKPNGAPLAFTGGRHHRDYKTLFQAIEGLPLKLHVAAPREHTKSLSVPSNVRTLGELLPSDYSSEVANCQFVILSLEPNLSRCPGVITYVAGMANGKCVVVNEPAGAPDYIEHGRTGFIVPPSDPQALRAQLEALLSDPELAQTAGANARAAAAERFSPRAYFQAVEAVASALG